MGAVIAGAAIIGAALGILGSGGSVLTVPVLVYGLGLAEKSAIANSLAIVGSIALFGALLEARRGRVVLRCLLAFGLPGVAGAALGGIGTGWLPGSVQLTLFGVVAILAAVQMLYGREPAAHDSECGPLPAAVAAGAGLGVLTSLIGVGGGFLLVPALIRFGGLDLPRAIGTSLALISVNASAGLIGQVASPAVLALDPVTIGIFVAVGCTGMVAGQRVSRWLPRAQLRQGFVAMLVLVAGLVLLRATVG